MQLPGEFSPFIEKKVLFLLSGRGGVTPPYTLSGPTTKKKNFFYVCLPLWPSFFLPIFFYETDMVHPCIVHCSIYSVHYEI